MFCPLDARANIFKVGGCASNNLLKNRLAVYNSGQSADNMNEFAAIWDCHDFGEVEARIKQIIGEFRQTGKKEVYIMHYTCLFTIIDFIVNHYNEETDQVNEFIRNIVRNMTELKPVVPTPIKLDRVEIVQVRNGEEIKREVIILDNMTTQEQERIIKDFVDKFRKPEQKIIKRVDFEKYLVANGIKDFKKRMVWTHLKKIVSTITGVSLEY